MLDLLMPEFDEREGNSCHIHLACATRAAPPCPGPVNTPLLQELFAKDPEKAARRLAHLPTGRFAEAVEFANADLLLASDESSYVTASPFLVDGGLTSAYVTPVELSEEGLRPLDAGQP